MHRIKQSLLKKISYPVPGYSNNIAYMFGGISATAFLILIVTGIFMSQAYIPTFAGAHSSILNSIQSIPFGDFMTSLHFWTANLVVILLLFHLLRVFITGSYKKPRRSTWLTGVALLGIVVIYIFVGTVLKADQEGIEALGHLRESFGLFGLHLGLTNFGVPIITQLYAWHTTILLLALISLVGMHIALIKFKGISSKPTKGSVSTVTAGTGNSTFLVHLKKLVGFGLIFLAAASIFAMIFPVPIGHPGLLNQEVTRPLWMFWPFFGLEDIFGLKGLVWGMAGFFTILASVPFLDRGKYIEYAKRKIVLSLGLLFIIITVSLGVYSKVHVAEDHLGLEASTTTTEIASPTSSVNKKASADQLNLNRQLLRSESIYLMPLMIAVGGLGAWIAFKKEKDSETNGSKSQ